MELISRSTWPFCQGEAGAVGLFVDAELAKGVPEARAIKPVIVAQRKSGAGSSRNAFAIWQASQRALGWLVTST